MRSGLLALMVTAGLTLTGQVAKAEQSVRINPDGSFTINGDPLAGSPVPKPSKAKPVVQEQAVQEPEPAPEPKPKKTAVKKTPAEKPKPVVQEEEKFESVFSPEPVEDAVPEPAPVKKIEKKAEKKKAPAKPKVKPERQAKQKPVPIEPVIDQALEEEIPQEPAGPITRDDALRIAIQAAPPFKRSTVLPGNYEGRPVFEVILQTEDGDQSILVDAETGDLVNPSKKKKK